MSGGSDALSPDQFAAQRAKRDQLELAEAMRHHPAGKDIDCDQTPDDPDCKKKPR